MERIIALRLEGSFAVCEKEDKSQVNILQSDLPEGIHEGSCLIKMGDGTFLLEEETYSKRKIRMDEIINNLFD